MIEEELEIRLSGVPEAEFKATQESEMPELESVLASWVNVTFPLSVRLDELAGKSENEAREFILEKITSAYDAKRKLEDPERLEGLERYAVVNAVDVHWQDHLTEMDELRRSVA